MHGTGSNGLVLMERDCPRPGTAVNPGQLLR